MDELPDWPVIHVQPAFGEFGDETAQGEVPILDPLQEPSPVLARNLLWLVPTHLAGRNAASLPHPFHPANSGADAHPKLLCGSIARHTAAHNRRNHPVPKID
jgi:hypothetical protein